jgi:membrane protein DedA with SNARE-associated domain
MGEIDQILATFDPLVRHYGLIAVFVILTLESIGFPLPGETLLIVSFALARRGEISFPGLLLFAWLGGVVGDNIGYLIGRWFGRAVILQYGQKIGLTASRLEHIEAVFRHYGPFTVAFARFFNILRQLNGVVSGMMNMNWWLFLFCNAFGCALWVFTWGMIGTYLVEHMSEIQKLADGIGIVGASMLALGLIVIIYLRKRTHAGR